MTTPPCLRCTIVLAVSNILLTIGLGASSASAETLNCIVDGYSAMGGMIYYTNTNTYLLAGNPASEPSGGMGTWGYAWLKFDASGLTEPVASATLTLQSIVQTYGGMYQIPENVPVNVAVYAATSDVALLTNSSAAQASFRSSLLGATILDTAYVTGGNGCYDWDITSIVNDWLAGDNYGLVIASQGDAIARFHSLESTTGSIPAIVTTAVPEPGAMTLIGIALIGLGSARVLRRWRLPIGFSRVPAVLLMIVAATASSAIADPGLLLVVHGSPSPEWNKPVLEFGQQVATEIKKDGRFKAVRMGMLESAKPDIPTAVAELESEGCDRIVAVPLFITPSGHTHFDVPAVLGIYSSPRVTATLASEGARAAKPHVPIILANTLAEGDVLRKYALDEVRKLSKTPQDEAIVVLAHGDPEHQLLVERMLRQVTTHCCGEAGISYGDWACIGMGHEYSTQAVPTIKAALEHKKRVLVIGLYLSTTAFQIHQRSAKMTDKHSPSPPLLAERVVMSNCAIINHPGLLSWVVKTAGSTLSTQSKALSASENREATRSSRSHSGYQWRMD